MPLEIAERREVTASLQAYARTELPDLDPTVTRRRGFIGGLLRSLGSALHDWYVKLKRYADREPFPQTATGSFLTTGWWVDITGLERTAASPARGLIAITGTTGTTLPVNSLVEFLGRTYRTDASSAVVTQSLAIASLTRDDETAIVETVSDHNLATGLTVTIAGADQAAYNGAKTITVTAPNEFTYAVSGSPATPATTATALTLSGTWGTVAITCEDEGLDTNIDAGLAVTIDSPPVGIDATAIVTFGTIGGGSDLETLESFRERVLEALGTDFGTFSAAEIKIVAKQIAGVTRVWVLEATIDGSNGVNEGQVKVYFMRDGDANPFPSTIETEAVKAHIFATIRPAHTAESDVMVLTPTDKQIAFTFTALDPDTPSMREAIRVALEQYFSESVDLGRDLTEDDYRCAIKAAYDAERRQTLTSFTLSIPTGAISVANDELPTLGTLTFPA